MNSPSCVRPVRAACCCWPQGHSRGAGPDLSRALQSLGRYGLYRFGSFNRLVHQLLFALSNLVGASVSRIIRHAAIGSR